MRIRAILRLSIEAAARLKALPDEERAGELRALTAAERRRHDVEIRPVGRSSLDERILYRWFCSCGELATGDYFVAAEARAAGDRHRGLEPAAVVHDPELRLCALEGCGTRFRPDPRHPRMTYCCAAHRRQAAQDRSQPSLVDLEDAADRFA